MVSVLNNDNPIGKMMTTIEQGKEWMTDTINDVKSELLDSYDGSTRMKGSENDPIELLANMKIGGFCNFNDKMGEFMNRLMKINLLEHNITLDVISRGAYKDGDNDNFNPYITKQYSYTKDNNYVEFVKDVKVKEMYGINATQNFSKDGVYVETTNLYPDDIDGAGSDNFRSHDKWTLNPEKIGKNSILYKTKELFKQKKIHTLISRFGTNADARSTDVEYKGSNRTIAYGESRGRNLLKKDAEKGGGNYNINGYNNPFCRAWTHHYSYDRMNKTLRPLSGGISIGDFHTWENFPASRLQTLGTKKEGELYPSIKMKVDYESKTEKRTVNQTVKLLYPTVKDDLFWKGGKVGWQHSVLDTSKGGDGLLRIAPKFNKSNNGGKDVGSDANIHTKDCMFSIENLAWKGYDPYSFENALSWEQRGPLGGRIMWFPPYGIQFSENTNVNWSKNTFIGRGEDVYTYVNTQRSGNLSFLMVVDHPSIIDYTIWDDKNIKATDNDVHRFFAGCDDGKGDDSLVSNVKPTPLTDEGVAILAKDNIGFDESYDPNKMNDDEEDGDKTSIEIKVMAFFPNNYSGSYDDWAYTFGYLLCGWGVWKTGGVDDKNIVIKYCNLFGEDFVNYIDTTTPSKTRKFKKVDFKNALFNGNPSEEINNSYIDGNGKVVTKEDGSPYYNIDSWAGYETFKDGYLTFPELAQWLETDTSEDHCGGNIIYAYNVEASQVCNTYIEAEKKKKGSGIWYGYRVDGEYTTKPDSKNTYGQRIKDKNGNNVQPNDNYKDLTSFSLNLTTKEWDKSITTPENISVGQKDKDSKPVENRDANFWAQHEDSSFDLSTIKKVVDFMRQTSAKLPEGEDDKKFKFIDGSYRLVSDVVDKRCFNGNETVFGYFGYVVIYPTFKYEPNKVNLPSDAFEYNEYRKCYQTDYDDKEKIIDAFCKSNTEFGDFLTFVKTAESPYVGDYLYLNDDLSCKAIGKVPQSKRVVFQYNLADYESTVKRSIDFWFKQILNWYWKSEIIDSEIEKGNGFYTLSYNVVMDNGSEEVAKYKLEVDDEDKVTRITCLNNNKSEEAYINYAYRMYFTFGGPIVLTVDLNTFGMLIKIGWFNDDVDWAPMLQYGFGKKGEKTVEEKTNISQETLNRILETEKSVENKKDELDNLISDKDNTDINSKIIDLPDVTKCYSLNDFVAAMDEKLFDGEHSEPKKKNYFYERSENKEDIKNLWELFKKSKLVSVKCKGFSNSHGSETTGSNSNNTNLATMRATRLSELIDARFGIKGSITIDSGHKVSTYDHNSLEAKKWRAAMATLRFEVSTKGSVALSHEGTNEDKNAKTDADARVSENPVAQSSITPKDGDGNPITDYNDYTGIGSGTQDIKLTTVQEIYDFLTGKTKPLDSKNSTRYEFFTAIGKDADEPPKVNTGKWTKNIPRWQINTHGEDGSGGKKYSNYPYVQFGYRIGWNKRNEILSIIRRDCAEDEYVDWHNPNLTSWDFYPVAKLRDERSIAFRKICKLTKTSDSYFLYYGAEDDECNKSFNDQNYPLDYEYEWVQDSNGEWDYVKKDKRKCDGCCGYYCWHMYDKVIPLSQTDTFDFDDGRYFNTKIKLTKEKFAEIWLKKWGNGKTKVEDLEGNPDDYTGETPRSRFEGHWLAYENRVIYKKCRAECMYILVPCGLKTGVNDVFNDPTKYYTDWISNSVPTNMRIDDGSGNDIGPDIVSGHGGIISIMLRDIDIMLAIDNEIPENGRKVKQKKNRASVSKCIAEVAKLASTKKTKEQQNPTEVMNLPPKMKTYLKNIYNHDVLCTWIPGYNTNCVHARESNTFVWYERKKISDNIITYNTKGYVKYKKSHCAIKVAAFDSARNSLPSNFNYNYTDCMKKSCDNKEVHLGNAAFRDAYNRALAKNAQNQKSDVFTGGDNKCKTDNAKSGSGETNTVTNKDKKEESSTTPTEQQTDTTPVAQQDNTAENERLQKEAEEKARREEQERQNAARDKLKQLETQSRRTAEEERRKKADEERKKKEAEEKKRAYDEEHLLKLVTAYHLRSKRDGTGDKNVLRYDQEYYFFKTLEKKDKIVYDKLMDKIKYFDPAFHSMTPEGFNARLTFLNQCTRQGNTISASDYNSQNDNDKRAKTANNLAFGRPPYCVLRLGDFYNQMIVINSINIDYSVSDGVQWDMNMEGVGMQPLLARVDINFNFIGGGDMAGPVRRLQNAMTFNYYANARYYDNRADRMVYPTSDKLTLEMGAMEYKPDTDKSYAYVTAMRK